MLGLLRSCMKAAQSCTHMPCLVAMASPSTVPSSFTTMPSTSLDIIMPEDIIWRAAAPSTGAPSLPTRCEAARRWWTALKDGVVLSLDVWRPADATGILGADGPRSFHPATLPCATKGALWSPDATPALLL